MKADFAAVETSGVLTFETVGATPFYRQEVRVMGTMTMEAPLACFEAASCSELDEDGTCSGSGPSCTCTGPVEEDDDIEAVVTSAGISSFTVATDDGPASAEYCATADRLVLRISVDGFERTYVATRAP